MEDLGVSDMNQWKNEAEAREQILALVAEYYKEFKKPEQEKPFEPGDRLGYAGRVYDEREMCALVEAGLDFWLTTGRFSDRFEKEFAAWLGVRFAHLVNSGSSANLLAFMALTAPELGDRGSAAGTRSSPWPRAFRRRSIPSFSTGPFRSSST